MYTSNCSALAIAAKSPQRGTSADLQRKARPLGNAQKKNRLLLNGLLFFYFDNSVKYL
jgi:hypothetical protein